MQNYEKGGSLVNRIIIEANHQPRLQRIIHIDYAQHRSQEKGQLFVNECVVGVQELEFVELYY